MTLKINKTFIVGDLETEDVIISTVRYSAEARNRTWIGTVDLRHRCLPVA